MPVHTVTLPNGGIGYQWGTHGAKYRDRKSARRQAEAAHANGAKDLKRSTAMNLIRGLVDFFSEEADEPEHSEDSKRGAGVAVRAPDGELLFVKRGTKGDHQGEWAFPGGMQERDEAPEATARRELTEETGYTASELEPAFSNSLRGVDFATFFHQAPSKFEPKLNDESTDHVWAKPDAPPEPLHPGVALALAKKRAADIAMDPPVSEAQRRAMFAAASGHSKLGIPKSVGQEFVGKGDDKPTRMINIECSDSDFTPALAKFLAGIKQRSDPGHSFSIEADRQEGDDGGIRTGIDGDGADRIHRVLLDGQEIGPDGALAGDAKGGKEKRKRDTFLYMEPPEGKEQDFAQCGTCEAFNRSLWRCRWLGGNDEITASMSCDLYVLGEGTDDTPMGILTAEQVGLVDRSVRCENCASFNGTDGCEFFYKLTKQLPELFDLDEKVKPAGCCNAQVPKPEAADTGAYDCWAFDKASVRSTDKDGRLHVTLTNISKAAINPYKGAEIPNAGELGLEPNRIYNLLRHPDELAKAAPTFNNLPLLSEHVPVTAVDHHPELVVGSTGTDCEFALPYLRNSLVVWVQDAIDDIESEKKKELSSAYRYRADMTPGTYDGQPYDGVMRDIVGNHVALVKEGRAGADVVVGDAAISTSTTEPEQETEMATKPKTALSIYLHGGLSTMVKKPSNEITLALDAAVAQVTAATIKDKPKRDALKARIAAIKNIAQDADLEGMHKFIDRLDTDMPANPDANLEEDPNKGSNIEHETEDEKREREARDAKFHASDRYKAARDEWEKEEKEANPEGKRKLNALSGDEPPDFQGKPKTGGTVDRKAMDAAIGAAVDRVRAEARAVREAEQFVFPWVGQLKMAFDTAEQVHRKTLDVLKVKHDGLHPDALRSIIEAQPKPGTPTRQSRLAEGDLAADEAARALAANKSFAERFPGAAQVQVQS